MAGGSCCNHVRYCSCDMEGCLLYSYTRTGAWTSLCLKLRGMITTSHTLACNIRTPSCSACQLHNPLSIADDLCQQLMGLFKY